MKNNEKKFNLIGFSFSDKPIYGQHRHCAIHVGTRLLKAEADDVLFCSQCGTTYPIKDTNVDQTAQSKNLPNSGGTKIISGRKNRRKVKYCDARGNEIPEDDTDAMHDIAEGRKILHYHEDKVEKEKEAR